MSLKRSYSKYPSLGILEALERLAFGSSNVAREFFYTNLKKNNGISRQLFSRKVYTLKRGGFIEYKNDQNFVLTKKGRNMIDFRRLESLELHNKSLDGFWRLVIFDIPEEKRAARDLLRNKLNEFNCYKIQKSVYVTPYDCRKEIEELVKILNVIENVDIVLAKSLGSKENLIKKFFRL